MADNVSAIKSIARLILMKIALILYQVGSGLPCARYIKSFMYDILHLRNVVTYSAAHRSASHLYR